jgi:protein-tyrosine-phosphatase
MAEAIARQTAADVIVPASAGTMALGFVAPTTLKVLEERGIGVEVLSSKPITRETRSNAEIIINMTGSPAKRVLPSEESKTEDWTVTDPYGERVEAYRDTYDEIEARMTEFAARLRARRMAAAESPARGK